MKYPEDYINKIIQGDCLEIMKTFPDKSVDLIVTDPPYGIDYQSGRRHIKYEKIVGDKEFPSTEKPVDVIMELIKANVGETVLDPFMGSGTTLLACKQLNRNYIGIEISEKYCEIAKRRLEQEQLF